MEMIRVIQVGLGPVGQMLTPYLLERNYLSVVGAVDIDPAKVGKDLGEICGLGKKTGITVRGALDAFTPESAEVAVVTTASKLTSIIPTLESAAKLRMNVVSTCEELVYPWIRQPDLSRRINALAEEHDVSFLGTGVNPGFLMDALAVTATGICRDVRKIRIERMQDASKRRIPFQQKIGTNLTVEEFRRRVDAGNLGHVGLTESMQMIAAALGWKLDRTEDLIEPVVADREIDSAVGKVAKGRCIGLQQHGRGWIGREEVLTLEFRADLGEKESHDSIQVEGTPEFRMTIPGGIHGDIATCAITANAVAAVIAAPEGLRTMIDIPPVSYRR
ncbi:MAG: dihydrodipicolinate reductase [Pseudomonadota bacterium]